ncbi:hypothetical protein DL98DRAFT_649231 [Cadophora sp. DSE1049]|nr:hypothetical protein DL98DRAFT_649231 [Cadophora sp. DSE1049]
MASELRNVLTRLGLQEYLRLFQNAGYDTWEALSKITESQLAALNVKLGHRRRLQREIARSRSWPDDDPLWMSPERDQRIEEWQEQDRGQEQQHNTEMQLAYFKDNSGARTSSKGLLPERYGTGVEWFLTKEIVGWEVTTRYRKLERDSVLLEFFVVIDGGSKTNRGIFNTCFLTKIEQFQLKDNDSQDGAQVQIANSWNDPFLFAVAKGVQCSRGSIFMAPSP